MFAAMLRSVTLLFLVLSLSACGQDARVPRNVILISVDTLRADHLGCYGYDRPVSPHVDQWALTGTRFVDVTAASPWTLPSHASLLTGLYPSGHGIFGESHGLPDEIPTLATVFREQGFNTMALVNSFYLSERHGFARDFDAFEYVSEWSDAGPRRRVVNGGAEITDTAIEWLGQRGDPPFFLFLHYYDVHSDYDPEPEFREGLVGEYRGAVTGGTGQLVEWRERGFRPRPEDVRHLVDLYDAEIRQLDAQLGRLFAFLDSAGLADETVVVLTSDHGEEFQEHGSFLHSRTYYQEVIAIPWILCGPGIPADHVVPSPVSLTDVAPTVLSLMGLPEALETDGRAWRFDGSVEPRFVFAEAHRGPDPKAQRMVRLGSVKLIHDQRRNRSHLFQLHEDPGERADQSEAEPDQVRWLLHELTQFEQRQTEGQRVPDLLPEQLQRLEELGYTEH